MTFTNKKMKDLNSSVDMIQRLRDELPALKQIDREAEFHLEMHEVALARDFLNVYREQLLSLYTIDYTPEQLVRLGYTQTQWNDIKAKRSIIPKDQWLEKIYTEILLLGKYDEFNKFKEVIPDWQVIRKYSQLLDTVQRAGLNLPEHYEQEEQIEM